MGVSFVITIMKCFPFNLIIKILVFSYKNRNTLMYNPEGVELTPEQQMEVIKNRQEIVHENTRLRANPFNENQSKETINELAKTQAKVSRLSAL